MFGTREGRPGDVKGVYSSSDDRIRLTYRCTKHATYIGSKVGGSSRWILLLDPVGGSVLALPSKGELDLARPPIGLSNLS